jgi:hypothetical protein
MKTNTISVISVRIRSVFIPRYNSGFIAELVSIFADVEERGEEKKRAWLSYKQHYYKKIFTTTFSKAPPRRARM